MSFAKQIDKIRRRREELIVRLTLEGLTLTEIARRAECSTVTVGIVRRAHGLKGRPGRPKRSTAAKAAE